MDRSIEELLEVLTNLVNDGFSLGRSKCVLDRGKIVEIIEEIQNELPAEIEQARKVAEAKNEILGTAKREAEAIKRAAEERARQMVSNEEIVVMARQKANEMVAAAEAKTKELKVVTNRYVDDALGRAEEALSEALKEVKESRGKFRQSSK